MSYEKAAQIAERASLVSAGGTGVAAFTLNEWAVIVGIVSTIVTTLLNWYYKQKHLNLARQRFEMMDGDPDE